MSASGDQGLGSRIREKAEAAIWCLLGAFAAVYGTGEHDVVTVMLNDIRIRRSWLWLAAAAVGLNISIFIYINVWLKTGNSKYEDRQGTPSALTLTGTMCLATASIATLVAIWPVWAFLSPLLLLLLGMGALMSLHFMPFGGKLNRKPSIAKKEH